MNISSIDKDIRTVLKSNYYKIPRFQRPYSWEREHIEDFWNDSIVNSDTDYFIGSMVVYKINEDTFGVVDGQQRLTTITMLLGAIREAFKIIGEKSLAKGAQGMIERKDLDDEMRYIIQTETSYPYFHESVQKYGKPDVDDSDLKKEEENIKKGFFIIKGLILGELDAIEKRTTIKAEKKQELKKKRLKEIRNQLLGLKVIYIDLDNEDDAYIIFETLNTRGKDLRVSDLVKNHLTKLLPKNNKGVDISKDKWTQSRDLIEGSSADLNMDSFLHHFWLSKYEFTTQKKLFKLLKKVVKKNNSKDFLDDIFNESKIYRGVLDKSYRTWTKHEEGIKNSLRGLILFRVKQQIPMLLSVMREYDAGNLKLKRVKDILKAIEYFHFIFTAITSQRSSGGISLMYAYHARQLEQSDLIDKANALDELKIKLRDKLPSKDEFLANFIELEYSSTYTKEKGLIKYILTKYDSYYSQKQKSGVTKNYDLMTIEHIHAEKPSHNSDANNFVGIVGNLILMDESLNGKLGNKPFKQKYPVYKDSDIFLDEKIIGKTTWGASEITKRTEFIGEKLYTEVFSF